MPLQRVTEGSSEACTGGLDNWERTRRPERVAIGRALLSQPRLLLLDEPLASLDCSKQDELLAFLRTVPTHFGIPMVLVSHRRREILALADTLVHIEEGKVVQSGPLESMLDSAPLCDFGTVTVGRVLRHHAAPGIRVRAATHQQSGHQAFYTSTPRSLAAACACTMSVYESWGSLKHSRKSMWTPCAAYACTYLA